MPLQVINNGEDGLDVRNALNAMLAELYGAIPIPIKLPGTNGNAQANIPANSIVPMILIQPVNGAPTIQIGSFGGGADILPNMAVVKTIPFAWWNPFDLAAPIYFTVAGGTVNISVLVISNLYE